MYSNIHELGLLIVHVISMSYVIIRRHKNDVNCTAPSTYRDVDCACEGEHNCTVPATNAFFGDPCPGTYKYLEIGYSCKHKGSITEVACEGETMR